MRFDYLKSIMMLLVLLGVTAISKKSYGVVVTINATGSTGSYRTGSVNSAGTTINDGNMVTINSSSNRGFASFDLSSLPAGAVVNSVTLEFTTYSTTSSTAANNIYGFTGDPATIAGATLYTNAGSGSSFNSTSWTGSTTANTVNTKTLNASGISFIQANMGNAYVNLGFVRGSTNTYNIYGYGTSTTEPKLTIDYTAPVACSGPISPITITTGITNACDNVPFTITSAGVAPGTSGVAYDWESSPAGTNNFTSMGVYTSSMTVPSQTAATDYRLKVTCTNTSSDTYSDTLSIGQNPFYNCYCIPVSTCTNEGIQNVTFGTLNNPSNKCTNTNGYEDFSGQGSLTNVMQGAQIPISVTAWVNSNPAGAGVWIDYDHNGVFDTTEFTLVGTFTGTFPTGGQAQVFNGTVTIDMGAQTGITRMRVRSANSTAATQISKYTSCLSSNAYGEYEDYLITIDPALACSGTPNHVTASASVTGSVCPSTSFSLSTANASTGLNLTYEWQYDDGINGWQPLLDINSMPVTSFSYTVPGITAPTSYRFISTCSGGGADTSNTITLGLNGFMACYCTPTGGGNTSYGINNFSTTGGWVNISNLNSGTTPSPGYHDYSATQMLSTSIGSVITIAGSGVNSGYTYGWAVWIDWNKNGSFADPGEKIYNSTSYNNAIAANTTFTVPAVDGNSNPVDTGYRRMRVIANYNNSNPSSEYCVATSGTAEWEDYMVNIVPPPSCLPPTSLNVSNITANTADLDWIDNNGASVWYVEYGPAPLTPGTGTIIPQPVSNPISISGLSDNTDYEFYVRSICNPGVDTSLSSTMGSFRTLCNAITALPWTETFETASPSLSCWQAIDGNNDGDIWSLYTGYSHNGTYSAGLYTDYNAGNNSDWLISPGITLNGNQRLRYWYRAQSSGEPNDYTVKMSTLTSDTLDFTTVLKPLTSVSNTTYAEDIIDLSGYVGTVYLAFHVPAGGLDGWYLYIDDVTVEDIPTCPAPTIPAITTITTTTADLDWMENGVATLWEIEYGTGSFTLGTGTREVVNSNPYTLGTLTPLTPATTYSYYVRAICGANDTSAWSVSSSTFTTACVPVMAPYSEDFGTGSNTTTPPNCWTRTAASGGGNWLFGTSLNNSYGINITSDHTGGGRFAWVDGSSPIVTGQITLFTSPIIDISNLTTAQVRYYMISYTTTTNVGFNKLAVDAYDYNLSDWVPIDSVQQNFSSQAWEERQASLASVTSTTTQLRFRFEGMATTTFYNDILIDDVNVENTPNCSTPSTLNASNITTTTADIDWVETGSATQWEIEYGPSSLTLGTGTREFIPTNPPSYSLGATTPLTSGTPYKFYVRAVCGAGDTSNWAGPYMFNTLLTNDECTGAIAITNQTSATTPSTTLSTTNIGATQSLAPIACESWTSSAANDVWYSVAPTTSGNLVFDIDNGQSGNIDAVMEVLSGACGSLTSVSCVDEAWPLTVAVTAGTTYYLRVYGYGGQTENFDLTVTGAPLAIKLDKLSAVNVGSSNRVEWNTFAEERSDKFELQRSADGKQFATIYNKDANGEPSRYTYMDNDPVKGYNYYRLRMTEANGNAAYSEVVKAFVKSSGFEVDAYPNPVSHDLTVKVGGIQGTDATLQVTDVTGKVIRTIKMAGNVEKIDMSGLANGIYLIKYSDANHTQTIKVNKQ